MTLRFQQGELAIFAVAMSHEGISKIGQQIEVTAAGPFKAGEWVSGKTQTAMCSLDCDYLIYFPADGRETMALDFQLRKINPPEEPETMKRTSDLEEEVPA